MSSKRFNEQPVLDPTVYFETEKRKTRKHVLVATILGAMTLSGVTYSLQAPLYPTEAGSKAITPAAYGFVFGAYEAAAFLVSIPARKLVVKIGPKCLFLLGLFLTGLSSIIFGSIPYIENKILFLAISIACRIAEGIGTSLLTIATVAILITLLPFSAAYLISWSESLFGIGMILGPVVGGGFQDAMSFMFPFVVIGCLLLMLVPLAFCSIPGEKILKSRNSSSNISSWQIATIPKIWFSAINIITAVMLLGFLNTTLASHLDTFNLIATFKGLVFLLLGFGSFGLFPLWNLVLEKGCNPLACILFGCVCTLLGYILIGPLVGIPLQPALHLILPGVFLTGAGAGGIIAPSLTVMKTAFLEKNILDSVSSNGMIGGIFMVSVCLGGFFGPVVGGILLEEVGFRTGEVFCLGQVALIIVNTLIVICCGGPSSPTAKDILQEQNHKKGISNKAYYDENGSVS